MPLTPDPSPSQAGRGENNDLVFAPIKKYGDRTMTGARHLTQNEARRLTLALQHLSVPAQSPLDVTRRLTAIQTQYAANLPGSLWARTPNVTPAWIEDALNASRTLVKTWTVRGTLHTVASEDLVLHVGAYGQSWGESITRRFTQELGVSAEEAEAILRTVFDALADGPLSRTELHARIPVLKALPDIAWAHDIKPLVYRGDVVFSGSRTSNAPVFAQRAQWLPHVRFEIPDLEDARVEMIRRYLHGHAPASARDIRAWIGEYAKTITPALSRLLPELVPVTIEGLKGTYYIHIDDLPVLDALPDALPVNLLPKFDALVLAHRGSDKSRLVTPSSLYSRIYGVAAQVEAVVLLNGEIVGTWRYKAANRKMTLTFNMFRTLQKPEQGKIEKEAARFAEWNGFGDAECTFVTL
jgi:hypothetical protein